MTNIAIYNLSEKIIQSPNFQKRFLEIQVYASKRRLSLDVGRFKRAQLRWLLLQGSVLALSDEITHKAICQKIIALLHERWPNVEQISYAIQILSSRIGNYPVISSSFNIFGDISLIVDMEASDPQERLYVDMETRTSISLEEQQARFKIGRSTLYFNLYQKEVLAALDSKSLVSFSAPTSFGKSFVVRNHIAKQFALKRIKKALIIVPTVSLIDDFYDSLISIKALLGLGYSIYTHARSLTNASDESIFILTQERLVFMLTKNPDFVKTFDLLYCDEAHYISRGYRGFILRNALAQVIALCGIKKVSGNLQYVFSSPLIKNPEYYKDYFFKELGNRHVFHKEIKYSPVEKNIHFVVKKSNLYNLYLLKHEINYEMFEERLVPLGEQKYVGKKHKSDDISKEIDTNIRVVVGTGMANQTILYVTNPLDAYKYAYTLSYYCELIDELSSDDLEDVQTYITTHYDDTFGLIEFIRKGIGLHYGKMPVGLRRTMVDLFDRGVLKYLICTSTLLEGVNLPARNIFIFSARQGGDKHNALSFWNLIGRAGRITYGLAGNVFCVSDDATLYKELIENSESKINDPEDEVADNRTRRNYVVQSFLNPAKKYDYVRAHNRDDIEYLIYELFISSNPKAIVTRFNLKIEDENLLLNVLAREKKSLSITTSVLMKNPGIDPRQQNRLLGIANRTNLADIRAMFKSISVQLAIKKETLVPILTQTQAFFSWPKPKKWDQIEPTAGKISQWLHENSISKFIQQRLKHHQDSTYIEKVDNGLNAIELLDKELSYNAPKYLKCFLDIYIESARQRNMAHIDTYSEKMEIFLYAIESGVCKLVSRYLFELGVSRPIAIRANEILSDLVKGPVTKEFFQRRDVKRELKAGLSKIAYKELISHF